MQSAVDAARTNMPLDLVPPVVSPDDQTQPAILDEAVSSLLLSRSELAQIVARNIVPALRATPGSGAVRSTGDVTRQLTVRPQAGALDALGGTPLDAFRAVAAGNDRFPGGLLRSRLRESTIGIDSAIASAQQIEALPVAIPGAPAARVRDVARVSDDHADRSTIARVDGDEAVLLSVSSAQGADALATIAALRRTVARLAARYPAIRFEELRTDRPSTDAAIAGVLQTLGEGVVLTVLVMLFFLHAWRSAAIAAIAIPTSLCAAFLMMWVLGFSLNVLSLMGLSLTIGILVDDSIVIIEAIAAAVARGLGGDEAALAGRREIGGAAFAITLVDVAVFLPIGIMSGIVGEFMREFALVIVFATAMSLLVSFTLTPLLCARWALAQRNLPLDPRRLPWTLRGRFAMGSLAAWHRALDAFGAWERRLCRIYAQRWLPAAMERPRLVFGVAAAVCALSLVPLVAGAIPAEFSPPVNRGESRFVLTLPPGTPLAATDAAVGRIAAALLRDANVGHVETIAGRSFDGSTDVAAGNVAQLAVVFRDPASNGTAIERETRALASLAPDATLAGAGKGMGGVPAVSYDVAGDPARIGDAAARIAGSLRDNPAAADVRTSDFGLQPRLTFRVDMDEARLLDVSPDDIAQTARIATGGAIADEGPARLRADQCRGASRGRRSRRSGCDQAAGRSQRERVADSARRPRAYRNRRRAQHHSARKRRARGDRCDCESGQGAS